MNYSTTDTYQMKRDILSFTKIISNRSHRPDKKFSADMVYGTLASGSCHLTDIVDQLHEKTKNVYTKGYHVTEACVLTESNHPVSLFSEIHSSKEKIFSSINTITFKAMERGAKLFGKATFVMDRGYDDNKMFLKLDELNQDYVIRLTRKRKVFYKGKFIPVTKLCNRRKGKVHMNLFYKGKEHDAYISHIKVQITASKKNVNVVLVYGITEHPMMLVTNKNISSKEEVINVAKLYFSRWRIEEYFRCKKQQFNFEDFRVRKLKAINALNFYITVAMTYLARITMKDRHMYFFGHIYCFINYSFHRYTPLHQIP